MIVPEPNGVSVCQTKRVEEASSWFPLKVISTQEEITWNMKEIKKNNEIQRYLFKYKSNAVNNTKDGENKLLRSTCIGEENWLSSPTYITQRAGLSSKSTER